MTSSSNPGSTAPASRITKPTKLTNVYAILHGTDPAQANRVVLVTGHYDSRNSDNFNTHDPAPGANDDASGTSVSIESARVLSKLKFPSTIIFLTVAGEEQGLNGSRHFAKFAKSQGWDLEAVLNNDIVGGDTTPGAVGADKSAVRVFSEGVPGPATIEQLHEIQTIGAENDSPARELARAIVDIDHTYFHVGSQHLGAGTPARSTHNMAMRMVPAFHPVMIFRRDRFGRGGDHTASPTRASPPFASPSGSKTSTTSTRPRAPKTASNTSTTSSTTTSTTSPTSPVSTRPHSPPSPQRQASPKRSPSSIHRTTSAPSSNGKNPLASPQAPPSRSSIATAIQPDWTSVVSAGTETNVALPISKDNVIFGVRSVDAAGHRSAAVYPIPPPRARPVPGTTPNAPPPSN